MTSRRRWRTSPGPVASSTSWSVPPQWQDPDPGRTADCLGGRARTGQRDRPRPVGRCGRRPGDRPRRPRREHRQVARRARSGALSAPGFCLEEPEAARSFTSARRYCCDALARSSIASLSAASGSGATTSRRPACETAIPELCVMAWTSRWWPARPENFPGTHGSTRRLGSRRELKGRGHSNRPRGGHPTAAVRATGAAVPELGRGLSSCPRVASPGRACETARPLPPQPTLGWKPCAWSGRTASPATEPRSKPGHLRGRVGPRRSRSVACQLHGRRHSR